MLNQSLRIERGLPRLTPCNGSEKRDRSTTSHRTPDQQRDHEYNQTPLSQVRSSRSGYLISLRLISPRTRSSTTLAKTLAIGVYLPRNDRGRPMTSAARYHNQVKARNLQSQEKRNTRRTEMGIIPLCWRRRAVSCDRRMPGLSTRTRRCAKTSFTPVNPDLSIQTCQSTI